MPGLLCARIPGFRRASPSRNHIAQTPLHACRCPHERCYTRHMSIASIKGRGAATNPANRFEQIFLERDADWNPEDDSAPGTQFVRDSTQSIIAYNDSPDVGFGASINPCRGCEHGCIYCYA